MARVSKPKSIPQRQPTEEDEESRDVLGRSLVGSLGAGGGSGGRFFANLSLEGYGKQRRKVPGTLSAASRSLSEAEEDWGAESRPRSASSAANLIVLRKASRPMSVEILGQLDGADNSLRQFLSTQDLYDVLPQTGKVVVLDQGLQIRRAFLALVETGVRAAPVWDSALGRPVAVLAHTDFLRILAHAHAQGLKDPDLQTIRWWLQKDGSSVGSKAPLTSLWATASLLDAAKTLARASVHRAPVMDPASGEIMGFVSLKSVLRVLHRQIRSLPLPSLMHVPLGAVGGRVGTWADLRSTRKEARLAEAVEELLGGRLSSLPVLDAQGAVEDVLTKADVIGLLKEEAEAALRSGPRAEPHLFKDLLELSVGEALALRCGEAPEGAVSERETLLSVADRLAASRLRALYVLDAQGRPLGVVSLSDLLRGALDLPKHGSDPTPSPNPSPRPPDSDAPEAHFHF